MRCGERTAVVCCLVLVVAARSENSTSSSIAMCVSGGFRTLATPAVSKALVDRMKRPLNADLFVFAGVGSLETRRHCPKKKSSSFEEPSREAIARWLGDASFVETVRRTAAVISPVAMRLVGCDGLESEWCLDAQAERTLYARAAGPCVDEAEVTTTSYAHGYHQWVLAAACFGLIEARGRYDFVVRWRPDAVWKGSILARGGRGSLDAWRFDKVLLGNHITAYCPAAQSPDCDLINDVFGVATWPVARAYFVGVFEIFRDEACRRDYVELARAARFECARDKSYPECKMATAVRRAGGDIPHICSPLKNLTGARLGCPFNGAGGPRGPPWGLRRWSCDLDLGRPPPSDILLLLDSAPRSRPPRSRSLGGG